MATTKARLLTQRYSLTGTYTAGANKKSECPLCQNQPETLCHFILKCPTLEQTRQPYTKKIKRLLCEEGINPTNDEEWLQCILDPPTKQITTWENRQRLECITRRLCFALHNRRCVFLGGRSSYVAVFQNVPVDVKNR